MKHLRNGFLFGLGLLPLIIVSIWLFHNWRVSGTKALMSFGDGSQRTNPNSMSLVIPATGFGTTPSAS
jgi:hypothetical protein